MKILVVASTMVHIKNFHMPYIEEFRNLGHDVRVLASGNEADFNIPFKKKALCFKNLLLASKIKKILKKEQFDVIYLHTTLGAFYTRLALKGIKERPYVINTVHGYLFSKYEKGIKSNIYLKCEKILKEQTDDIVVMNDEDFQIATENSLCKNKVYKINGMGITLKTKEPLKNNDGLLNLTFVGEISKRKNQALLVKALTRLPNAMLTLVGDGKERAKIEALAKKLNVEDRLVITGFTKNVARYLSKTDIYVSASKIEGLPFNIMEAMGQGLPIVASKIKGHTDLLSTALLFECDDINSFVDAIKNTKIEQKSYDIEKYKLENVLNDNMKIYLSFINR